MSRISAGCDDRVDEKAGAQILPAPAAVQNRISVRGRPLDETGETAELDGEPQLGDSD